MPANTMKTRILTLTACLMATFASAGHATQVTAGTEFRQVRNTVVEQAAFQRSGMTLSQAVEQVRRQYGGRIVSAETKVSGGRETHVIKVLTDDGKVKTVRIPGKRG